MSKKKNDKKKYLVLLLALLLLLLLLWQSGIFNPSEPSPELQWWYIDISTSPTEFTGEPPVVSPIGSQSIAKDTPLLVTAETSEDWSFVRWHFDGEDSGVTPIIMIPPQTVNSTHVLIAEYVEKQPDFTLTPTSKSFVSGQTEPAFWMSLSINEDVTITSVKLRLNDPYGIFLSFGVASNWYTSSISSGCISTQVLNQYASTPIIFDIIPTQVNSGVYSISTGFHNILCGRVGVVGPQVVVSNSISSGTYHLTWEIIFTITDGDFSIPPYLVIPWDVTVYG